MATSSPMMQQYRRIKKEHRDEVLFFRLGDFYEMFAEDAIEVSSLLNLTLTSRSGLPMCGIPYHAARTYIARLLKAGKKIAICEQISVPGPGKGIAERRVVEVITPGTTIEEDYLDGSTYNYLAALAFFKDSYSFAYIDASTGDFYVCSFGSEGGSERLAKELERIAPHEILVQESLLEEQGKLAKVIAERSNLMVNRWPDWLFDTVRGADRLEAQFGTSNLKGFGLDRSSIEVLAAGAILSYLDDTAQSLLPHVRNLKVYGDDDYVGIDESSQRNLELVRSIREGDSRFTLLEVLNETKTSMGLRLLKRWILHPLRDVSAIQARLNRVEALYRKQERLASMREALSRTPDLERLASRIAMDRAHAKDLVSIRLALGSFEKVEAIAAGTFSSSPGIGAAAYLRLAELRKELEQAILDDPSILLSEGKLIKEGYSTELDALQHIQKDSRAVLEAYLEEEKTATGISSLKMRYNRLIGYFFEVTKTNLALVPPHFIRRQGIVGGERYSTEKLAGLEVEINEASGKVIELERKLFLALRDKLKTALVELLDASRRIAELDVYQSFARSATVRAWNKPSLDEHKRLRILEGRHPVVEEQLHRGQFVPNDLELDSKAVSFALITGPNMAGKSTYLRQAALITLMAQIGSFVPAREAEIGIVDRIFCRVGASDNLARGESTFLVEMNETANILRSATDRSLVIMDEVGRGTGTNDGLSIAWAICEDLLDNIGCRTLFASHYHELSSIVHPSLANRSMEVLEREGEIVFLRKLREGSALDSYGPHVARLAGVPERVVRRAEHILASLKANESKLHLEMDSPEVQEKLIPEPRSLDSKFLKALRSLDIEKTTPLEAFAFLSAWKEELSASIAKKKPLDHQIEKKKEGPSLFD